MDKNREPAFWRWFFLLGGCCGVVGYCLSQDDHVAAVTVIVLALSTLGGYCMMASRLLCLHCGLVAATVVTSILGLYGHPTLVAWFGMSGFVLSLIGTGLVVLLATTMALRRLVVKCFSERPSLEPVNRWAGFGIGAGQGAILCMLVLGGLLVLEPLALERRAADVQLRDHKFVRVLATKVIDYAGKTRESAIGPQVAQYNPFHHWSPLKDLRNDLQDLDNPLTGATTKSQRMIDRHLSSR